MFGQQNLDTRVCDFATADAHWENTKPWRGDSVTDPRPLAKNRESAKRHYTIVRRGADYACEHHGTELVRFHSNGNITVTGWDSKTSGEFIDRLLPGNWRRGLCFSRTGYDTTGVYWLGISDGGDTTYHPFETYITLRPKNGTWVVVEGHCHLDVPTGDRKTTHRLKKANPEVDMFTAWYAARLVMIPHPKPQFTWQRRDVHMPDSDEVLDYVRFGIEGWKDLASKTNATPAALRTVLLKELRTEEGWTPPTRRVDSVVGMYGIQSVVNAYRRYADDL